MPSHICPIKVTGNTPMSGLGVFVLHKVPRTPSINTNLGDF